MSDMSSYINFVKGREYLEYFFKQVRQMTNLDMNVLAGQVSAISKRLEAGGKITKEEQKKIVIFKQYVNNKYVGEALKITKIFEMDKVKKRMMLLTDDINDKNLLEGIKMPFQAVFLDVDISREELPNFSERRSAAGEPWSREEVEKISGILLFRIRTYDNPQWSVEDIITTGRLDGRGSVVFMAIGVLLRNGEFQIQNFYFNLEDSNIEYEYFGSTPVVKFLAGFVRKFLLFIEYPEVEIIERKRSNANRERRAKSGKLVLPDSNFIKLTGKLKIYENKYFNDLNSETFNFRFWVRGHFRHLRAERYKEKKVLWIEPFLKGKPGTEIRDKTYVAEASPEEEKAYKNDFLFYDDIEPAEKPLR